MRKACDDKGNNIYFICPQWRDFDPENIDSEAHRGKGKGSKQKSNIARLFTQCKGEIVERINRQGKNRHMVELCVKRKPGEIETGKDGKKKYYKKEKRVARVQGR